jgi:hypothetical protein
MKQKGGTIIGSCVRHKQLITCDNVALNQTMDQWEIIREVDVLGMISLTYHVRHLINGKLYIAKISDPEKTSIKEAINEICLQAYCHEFKLAPAIIDQFYCDDTERIAIIMENVGEDTYRKQIENTNKLTNKSPIKDSVRHIVNMCLSYVMIMYKLSLLIFCVKILHNDTHQGNYVIKYGDKTASVYVEDISIIDFGKAEHPHDLSDKNTRRKIYRNYMDLFGILILTQRAPDYLHKLVRHHLTSIKCINELDFGDIFTHITRGLDQLLDSDMNQILTPSQYAVYVEYFKDILIHKFEEFKKAQIIC